MSAMQYLKTHIALPPGQPPRELIRKLLFMIFEHYHWFPLVRYGFPVPDEHIPSNKPALDSVLAIYDEFKAVSMGTSTDQDYLMVFPAKPGSPPYAGSITWATSQDAAAVPGWQLTHMAQISELMQAAGSPLAYTATDKDTRIKTRRLVDHGTHQQDVSVIRGYGEGLAGLFWRNFYGPPFVRLFGERLNALPPECVTRLGEELVLVQPYELPTEAGTEAAHAREQHLISLLGPECFYDHALHRPPSRRPVLDPPPA